MQKIKINSSYKPWTETHFVIQNINKSERFKKGVKWSDDRVFPLLEMAEEDLQFQRKRLRTPYDYRLVKRESSYQVLSD